MMRRITKYLIGLSLIIAAAVVGGMFGQHETTPVPKWPNWPGCQLNIVANYPNDDGSDVATILRRNCNMEENVTYFLRLNFGPRPGSDGWWNITELENDAYPEGDPSAVWTNNSILQVTISTKALSGTLVWDTGSNIVVTKTYKPRKPGTPSYW